uniref:Ribonuclease A-domain domain-containing protein n=1 Tax=Electrophorus electricus TaxID=8005 RepID=A0AAY5ED23_ELEEL
MCLLLALSATLLVDTQTTDVMRRYKHFLRQHVIEDMELNQCDQVINKRNINKCNTNNCKEINTFILATDEQVRAVCSDGGTPKGRNLYESTKRFPLVICKLKKGARCPKCEYNGKKSRQTITVACVKGWPVHFEGSNIVLDLFKGIFERALMMLSG